MSYFRVVLAIRWDERPDILVHRRYPNVEVRGRTQSRALAVIPDGPSFVTALMSVCQREKMIGTRCLEVSGVWPVMAQLRGDLLLAVVPLVDCERPESAAQSAEGPVSDLEYALQPFHSSSVALLDLLARLVIPVQGPMDSSHLAEVQTLLSALMPFGKPIEATLANIKGARRWQFGPKELQGKDVLGGSKRPVWKPQLFRGARQQIEFVFREEISSSQYDHETPDVSVLAAAILCKADLEGQPEVTASLVLRPRPGCPYELYSMSLHHCCQQTDALAARKLCFVPPVGVFTLASYHSLPVPGTSMLPFRGYYQMKELSRTDAKLLVQLKLSDHYTNRFEYCRVVLPFPNRGPIVQCEMNPSVGTVVVDERREALIWNLGTKITGRQLEVSLPGNIRFEPRSDEGALADADADQAVSSRDDATAGALATQLLDREADAFCVGPNVYASVSFKILGDSVSGLDLDSKNVALYPSARAAVQITHEIIGRDYLIWNSYGDIIAVPSPIHREE